MSATLSADTVRAPVSVLVPTRNEEANIARCLDALQWADEIVVVDSSSKDRTQEIARAKGAKVVNFQWDGKGPKKRNWALDNFEWRNEWVLFVDADEEISAQLRDEIIAKLRNPSGFDGFVATSRFVFLGRLLRHGAPIRKLILCRHAVTRYERVDIASAYDMEIHEHPVVRGQVGALQQELVHHHFDDLHRHFERHNVYSDWDAKLRSGYLAADAGQELQARLFGNQLERRRWLKRYFMRMPGKPFLYFLYSYVMRGGFLDGKPGFIYNVLRAFYWFQVSVKMYELALKEDWKREGAVCPP